MNTCPIFLLAATMLLASITGCDSAPSTNQEAPPTRKATPHVSAAPTDLPEFLTADELRRRLKTDDRAQFRRSGKEIVEARLMNAGIRSVEPLKGLPLRFLDLGFCEHVTDISALAGMPLTTLILEGTSVADLSPLAGMPLEVLHLQDIKATDLSVVSDMPLRELNLKGLNVTDVAPFAELRLKTLWLPETKVVDISPLRDMPLESLDLQDTPVSDISGLSEMNALRRLNIAGTEITDISALSHLNLDRIILSPKNISAGMEQLRTMKSLGQIWTSHQNQMTADSFWERWDLDVWDTTKDDTESDASDSADPTDAQRRCRAP